MTASNSLDEFCNAAICKDLDAMAVAQVMALAQPVSFVAGSRLVRQGEDAHGAYILRKGEVEARITLPGGGEQTVAQLGAGSMFGETALLERGMRSASIIAKTHVDGWYIEREEFRSMVKGRNAAALTMQRTIIGSLATRLGALNAALRAEQAAEDRPLREALPAGDPLATAPRQKRASFDIYKFLHLLPFFDGFAAAEIDAATAGLPVLELERGHWLYLAGEPAAACFLVVRGAIEAKVYHEGNERRLAVLGPGSLVGYLSLLGGTLHGACTRVRENATLLEISRARFLELYLGNSPAAAKVQHAIARNLLQSLGRSYSQISRLISQSRLSGALQAKAAEVAL